MSPFEYFTSGLAGLLQSVLSLVGLVSLALVLLAFGFLLLVGIENVRTRWGSFRNPTAESNADVPSKASKKHSHTYPPPKSVKKSSSSTPASDAPRSSMRPYKVAKARSHSDTDKILGLVFVLAGLGLLWIVPAYLSSSGKSRPIDPPIPEWTPPQEGRASRRVRAEDSASGQSVLGMITLAVLLLSFALLKPGKSRPVPAPATAVPTSS
ncbi:hypothetical protein EMMF5_002267 [Cystobasidiomycetes sp. EMM_F5]